MKKILKIFVFIFISEVSFFAVPAMSAQQVKMLGVPLSDATRATLGQALIKAGFKPVRITEHLKYNKYNVTKKQFKGAYLLDVGYTYGGRFAIAEYFLYATDLGGHGSDTVAVIKDKYGNPSFVHIGMSNSVYIWKERDGIEIVLHLGFLSSNLKLINIPEYRLRLKQIKKITFKKNEAVEKSESNAF